MSELGLPFGLRDWIDEHADEFDPPVSNKVVWADRDLIFMVIRGPNARNDFHIDPYDEIFVQLRGSIRVDIISDGGVREQRMVGEGEIMLVPGGTPHAPLRPADTWGVVIERPRPEGVLDQLVWFCQDCGLELYRTEFHVGDIESELSTAIESFNRDEQLRSCSRCGHVEPVPAEFEL